MREACFRQNNQFNNKKRQIWFEHLSLVKLDKNVLLFIMKVSHSFLSDSLWPHGLYSPWNSPGQNTRVGSHSLLQGIFPSQGSNPGLPHYRWILYQLSHKGSPRILEWVTYPFPSGSSWPRNQTAVSCIAGRFFTNWAIREALKTFIIPPLHIKKLNLINVL